MTIEKLDHLTICMAQTWGGVCDRQTRYSVDGDPRCVLHRPVETSKQKIARRLTEQGFVPSEASPLGEPHRIYTGHWMRKEGTWSWGCQTARCYVGSPLPMGVMLKCSHDWPHFTIRGTSDIEFHPCDECTRT